MTRVAVHDIADTSSDLVEDEPDLVSPAQLLLSLVFVGVVIVVAAAAARQRLERLAHSVSPRRRTSDAVFADAAADDYA